MPKPKRPKCTYYVFQTEFWRRQYRIEAENPGAALVAFECFRQTGALPLPASHLLGSINPPEEVQDVSGRIVLRNTPPGDDAERMLFLEMWVRMFESQPGASQAIKTAIRFICTVKQWDPDIQWEEVKRRVATGV